MPCISQGTLRNLGEKIFDFKVASRPNYESLFLNIGLKILWHFIACGLVNTVSLNFATLECSGEGFNSKQNHICSARIAWKVRCKSEVFTSLPQMTSHKPFSAEISNNNIFHITQYFWANIYKRNQWNLPNISAYTYFGYIQRLFQRWVSPFKSSQTRTESKRSKLIPTRSQHPPQKKNACRTIVIADAEAYSPIT